MNWSRPSKSIRKHTRDVFNAFHFRYFSVFFFQTEIVGSNVLQQNVCSTPNAWFAFCMNSIRRIYIYIYRKCFAINRHTWHNVWLKQKSSTGFYLFLLLFGIECERKYTRNTDERNQILSQMAIAKSNCANKSLFIIINPSSIVVVAAFCCLFYLLYNFPCIQSAWRLAPLRFVKSRNSRNQFRNKKKMKRIIIIMDWKRAKFHPNRLVIFIFFTVKLTIYKFVITLMIKQIILKSAIQTMNTPTVY